MSAKAPEPGHHGSFQELQRVHVSGVQGRRQKQEAVGDRVGQAIQGQMILIQK